MNERTHFFIKIYLSHFIRKCWCWLSVRGELETGTDCLILTQSSSDHRRTSSSSSLGFLNCVSLEAASSQSANWFSHWHLVPNWLPLQLELPQAVCGTWLYNCLISTCFRCFSAYLHRFISWLMARSRVNIKQFNHYTTRTAQTGIVCPEAIL